jgi:hypothetical protein
MKAAYREAGTPFLRSLVYNCRCGCTRRITPAALDRAEQHSVHDGSEHTVDQARSEARKRASQQHDTQESQESANERAESAQKVQKRDERARS